MEWAAQQWGRLIWWLKQNSEVIQAVSSAVTACIAGYLVGFNRRAVKAAENSYQAARDQFDISQKQFELTGKQFALALQPKLAIRLLDYTPNDWGRLTFYVKNTGAEPVKVPSIILEFEWNSSGGVAHIAYEINVGCPFVIVPDDEVMSVDGGLKEQQIRRF